MWLWMHRYQSKAGQTLKDWVRIYYTN
jgi:hypothetical protein